jgi:photosystem II stability/assembly factor-like uncharacterized protein
MSETDLESRLRSYYGRFHPDDSTRLTLASARLLEDWRRTRARRSLRGAVRLAGTVAGAVVVLAVLVLARFNGGVTAPGAGTGSPGPAFDVSAALRAQVDMSGAIRNGGIWAVQGTYLLTSEDNGVTWRAGSFPSPSGLTASEQAYVLDQDHAWALTSVRSTSGTATPALPGTISRTSDGGRTWQSAPVSGDFDCPRASLSFVDARHGFILCAVPSTPGPSGPTAQSLLSAKLGSGTVLTTDDAGATWSVAGSASGLSEQFIASDASTLWSVPDTISSQLTGARLYVSRNAGATWSAVELPELAAVPAEAEVLAAAGPAFWDASDGTFAVGVWLNGSSTGPAIWFYRTSDAGRSWSVVKKVTDFPMLDFPPSAAVGRVWAARMLGNYNLAVSGDFGVSWTDVSGSGMPENTSFLTLDLIDKNNGMATVFGVQGTRVLMLTRDGGRTWHAADFGDARAKLGANSADPVAAANLAENYATMAMKDPPTAWNMLSAYSQRVFGSEASFATAEADLGQRTNYTYSLADPTQSAGTLSLQNLGPSIWADLAASADIARAYLVVVTFPGSSEPAESLVLAPLSATGEWRVWIATATTAAVPSPNIGREEAIRLASIASGYADPLVGTVELKADGGPFWPGRMVWSVQFNERAGASSGAAIVYVDAITGETRVVARG